ncbi:MAG: AAA family ATPase [Candidatus Falkowbacteria bacterium]|nr:AAA family ATPase [Candidatus Falkowbacteria bacterium]
MDIKKRVIEYFQKGDWPFENEGLNIRAKCMSCKNTTLVFDFETGKYTCENTFCDNAGEIDSFLPKEILSDPIDSNDLKISTCQELLNYEVEPEYFIVKPLIPENAITNICSDSGKGKSLLALIIAYHIASGKPLFDEFPVKQGGVLLIDQEQNLNTVVSRFKKVVTENLPIDYIIDQKFLITDEENFECLIKKIKEQKYKVIIFDTFTEIHDKEENESGPMKIVNRKLLELIRRTNVSLVYLHHLRKPFKNEKLSQSSSRGSGEIIAKCSSNLLLESKNSADEFGNTVLEMTISQEKSRSSERLNGRIAIKIFNDPENGFIKWQFMGEIEEKGKRVEEAKILIMETLQTVPGVTVKDLEGKTEIGSNNLRSGLRELMNEGKIDCSHQGRAKYYFPLEK